MIYREASSELKQVPIAGEYVGTWWMRFRDSLDRYHPKAVCSTSPALRGHFFNEESAMTKSATEFTPTHEDKTQEALARYHAKLDTLRSVLIECAARDGKEMLEGIAENISAAFDKIQLDPDVELPSRLVSYNLLEHYQGMSKQQCSMEATRLVKVASEKGNIFSLLSNLLILENIYRSAN